MWGVSLYLCALVDGMLAGHRDGLGRNPLHQKGQFYALALLRGVILVHLVLAVVASLAAASLWCAAQPGSAVGVDVVLDAAGRCAQVMILVYGSYAAIIGLGLFSYILPVFELRSYVTIGLFGVLTIARPFVIALGAFCGLHAIHGSLAFFHVMPVVVAAALLMTPLDLLHRRIGWNRFDWEGLMGHE